MNISDLKPTLLETSEVNFPHFLLLSKQRLEVLRGHLFVSFVWSIFYFCEISHLNHLFHAYHREYDIVSVHLSTLLSICIFNHLHIFST